MRILIQGFLLAGIFGFMGCNTAPKPTIATQQADVLVKSPNVALLVKENTLLFDVRPSFESSASKVPNSVALSPGDLGLRDYLKQNDYQDIHSHLRRLGVQTTTPVVLIGDSAKDLQSLGYVGITFWAFGVKKIDVTDFSYWRVKPTEVNQVKESRITDLNLNPESLETSRQEFLGICTSDRKCQCVVENKSQAPRRLFMSCNITEVPGSIFWSKDKLFRFSAREELQKRGLKEADTIYIPWGKNNLFTAFALLRFGYKVQFIEADKSRN